MLVIHRLPPQEDGKRPERFVVYSAPDGFDLEQGIHDAGVEFCYGFYKYSGEMADLTNEDFVRFVDNDTCEMYGFSKLMVREESVDVDPDSICVSVRELKHLFTERDEGEKRNTAALEAAKARETAIQAAISEIAKKMEASVRRHDSKFAHWKFDCTVNQVIAWAKEFVDSGATDLNKFYHQKLKQIA